MVGSAATRVARVLMSDAMTCCCTAAMAVMFASAAMASKVVPVAAAWRACVTISWIREVLVAVACEERGVVTGGQRM